MQDISWSVVSKIKGEAIFSSSKLFIINDFCSHCVWSISKIILYKLGMSVSVSISILNCSEMV